jgi:hypothetical protein
MAKFLFVDFSPFIPKITPHVESTNPPKETINSLLKSNPTDLINPTNQLPTTIIPSSKEISAFLWLSAPGIE